ncbi:MAG: PAS domain-containing sensor histidine kinase [Actinomycetota bacterium]
MEPQQPRGRAALELERLRHTERTMGRIRWAGVAFGVVHALTFYRPYPDGVLPGALVAMALLGAGNVVVWAAARRATDAAGMRRVALGALALDLVGIMALVFVYTFDVETAIWAVTYLLPLEGAVRFQLRGAMATMGIVAVVYAVREVYGTAVYGNELLPISISFRMGIGFLIAAVAGSMASSLVRDRRQAEDATVRYESILAAMSHLGQGVAIADADRLVHVNEALGRILGYTPGELLALPSWMVLIDPEHREEVAGRGDPAEDGVAFETVALHRDGRRVHLEVGLMPVEIDGQPLALAIVRDITERKQADAELAAAYRREREAVKRLQELDAVKTDFLATVSHELRTPVTKIVGFSATLLARWEAMDEEMRMECVRRISAGGNQLTRLISELLDFGRIEQGTLLLEVAPCSLSEVVDQTMRDLGAVLEQHRVELDLAPALQVLANRDGLVRILDNLLTNAVKFSPPGTQILIRGRHRGAEEVLVEVEDEGIGIPPEECERVFERFHRLHREPSSPSGTGVGLAVVKEFVEAQGGRAWVSPRSSGGALLRFTLWAPGHLPAGRAPARFDRSSDG